MNDEHYMQRCLQLAKNGMGRVAPNPMVGSVIVYQDQIIGEGYHRRYGFAHAEVNAIESVRRPELLSQSTLYVNLEPCSHYGHTPPCAALIIEKKIPRVVISNIDPNPKVAGRGIKMMREAGIEVITGVLEQEGEWLNRRFFVYQRYRRPYVMLKWAQSADGYIDQLRAANCQTPPVQLSSDFTKLLVHKNRTEENAIMVGTTTAVKDNPKLTAHHWVGKHPLRIVVDRKLRIPSDYHLFDHSVPTIVYTEQTKENEHHLTFVTISFAENVIHQIMSDLFKRHVLSVVIEGGEQFLNSFIRSGIWDEARVEIAPIWLGKGVKAPMLPGDVMSKEIIDGMQILTLIPKQQSYIALETE
ncbi:MAG: bifunctional diaminohydroxyphosphoribosylaminopyrimidine deaminase/5-amino-6-(5-phosphoribosylamino)uracil reductase RibD [Microbacter sp.]